jgi:DNA repair exonuclease SbcCD ATPase subunit
VQEVKKKLEDLRQQKERFIAQKAEADTCWQNAQARLTEVQAEIEEASSEILSPSQEQELLQLESQRGHVEELRQEWTELIAEQKTVEKALAAARGLKDKCPTCWQPISEAAKASEIETLGERLAELEGLIQGTREELNEYGDLEAATSRLETHRRSLARRAKLLKEQSEVQEVQKPDTVDLESRMTILAERINKGDRVLEKAQQAQSAKERWELYLAEKSSLEARISLLDKLTEFFGLNGAIMRRSSGQVGSFTESLNRHLKGFGYACNFTHNPFEIGVMFSTGFGPLPLKHLAESERFRFSIAFQLALATVTGIRFVVIDRADVLDKERRKLLTGLLLKSDLDQAIVLATGEEPPPTAIPPGVKFFDLTRARELRKASEPVAERPSIAPAQTQLLPQHN